MVPVDNRMRENKEDKSRWDEVSRIQNKHESDLLKYSNVVGISNGFRIRDGKNTNERCIVVLVAKKVSEESLDKEDVIPKEIDSIKTDVVEVGQVEILPS